MEKMEKNNRKGEKEEDEKASSCCPTSERVRALVHDKNSCRNGNSAVW
jgi:hypothetical protein